MNEQQEQSEHLSAATVASYLEGRLDQDETVRIRSHLVECEECRADVVQVEGALSRIDRTRRQRVWMPTAAAAAVVGILIFGGGLSDGGESSDVVRGPEPIESLDASNLIPTVAPAPQATITPGSLVFTWRAVGDETLYRVTLSDAGGDPLWGEETRDTSVVVPAHVVLEANTTYRWYVDGLLQDGRTMTTGIHTFRTP